MYMYMYICIYITCTCIIIHMYVTNIRFFLHVTSGGQYFRYKINNTPNISIKSNYISTCISTCIRTCIYER